MVNKVTIRSALILRYDLFRYKLYCFVKKKSTHSYDFLFFYIWSSSSKGGQFSLKMAKTIELLKRKFKQLLIISTCITPLPFSATSFSSLSVVNLSQFLMKFIQADRSISVVVSQFVDAALQQSGRLPLISPEFSLADHLWLGWDAGGLFLQKSN